LKEKWLCENTVISILYYVEYFRHKFTRSCEIEHDNLKQSQDKIKHWYEKKLVWYCLFIVIHYKLNTVGHMQLNPD
jgi:hypothetical protein